MTRFDRGSSKEEKRFDPYTAPYRDCPICLERVFFHEAGDYFHIGKTNEIKKTTHYQFFHKECFMEMAGENFMDKLTMEVPWCSDKDDNWRGGRK